MVNFHCVKLLLQKLAYLNIELKFKAETKVKISKKLAYASQTDTISYLTYFYFNFSKINK